MNKIDRFIKAWAREDKDIYQAILLQGRERGLLKKRGDIGDYATQDKRKQKSLNDFYNEIRREYGTVTEKQKKEREEYKKVKDDFKSLKSYKEYKKVKKRVEELLTYAYNTYDQSTVNKTVAEPTKGMPPKERLEEILKWLNSEMRDFSQGVSDYTEIDFSTTYEDVESWFE